MAVNDKLTLNEAVKLILNRVLSKDEDRRAVEDRIRHLIRDHVERGILRQNEDQTFTLGWLIGWADSQYPGKFSDLPKHSNISPTGIASTCEVGTPVIVAPENLDDATQQLLKCQAELAEAHAEIESLKTDANSWREWNKKKGKRVRD